MNGIMEGGSKMKRYKYFDDVIEHACFTEECCQFCGSHSNCLEGIYFEQDNVTSVCLDCFETGKATVDIPSYLQKRVHFNKEFVRELASTPPIPWVQFNDWRVCCGDFMIYVGEWSRDDFITKAGQEDPIKYMSRLIDEKELRKVEEIENLWSEIGNNTVAYVFKCSICGKIQVVCQSY